MTLSHILMALGGSALGAAACWAVGGTPNRRSAVWLLILAVAASALAGIAYEKPQPNTCYHPRDVQAVWLDGAWRCITTEQAG